jgi:type IV pilus assembly protein PilB
MQIKDDRAKEILLQGSYVTEEDFRNAENYIRDHRGSLLDYLLGQNIITKDILGQAVAESYNIPYSDLNSNKPSREAVNRIPEDIARKFRLVLFKENGDEITIATDNPEQSGIEEELYKIFPGKRIVGSYSLSEDIDAAFAHYRKPLETRFSKLDENDPKIAPKILEMIFTDAFELNASDVHFEPTLENILVRFRVDGVLRDAGHINRLFYENILNRIKIESGIRLDEHFAAQDGAMQFQKEGMVIDLRTSIVPTVKGEKIVLRVLNSYLQGLNLTELGLSDGHKKTVEENADKPFGMIVVCGPTGSGKTTTLYALLKILNKSDVNITTIEDPVEYKMEGVNQIQVNALTNLTFAKGLRSIVRQDPDIILVGEIRDIETAEIAVNAALTGHLMLSTFHANDAATAIPRLLDMGVEPFLLASTLELVVGQRLVRRICDNCKYSINTNPDEIDRIRPGLRRFFWEENMTLYRGKGCEVCGFSGFKGRTGIFEMIQIGSDLENMILRNPSSQEIWKVAREKGAYTLFEDGVSKVKAGVTTIEELLRVAEPPQF